MQRIIVDLEFTPIPDKAIQRNLRQEIIEIGAVRLDDNFAFVDSFDTYVRPEYTNVDRTVYHLTGIERAELAHAPLLDDALDAFQRWIGPEPFRIYQWSENDKKQIVQEIRFKALEKKHVVFAVKHWCDIQRLYTRVFHKSSVLSLKNALAELALEFEGQTHNACDDAKNTARLLQTMAVKEIYAEVVGNIQNVLQAPKRTSSIGDILGLDFSALYAMCEAQ